MKIEEDEQNVMQFARNFGRDFGTQLAFMHSPKSFCIVGKTCYTIGVILPNGEGTKVFPEVWKYDDGKTPQQFIESRIKGVSMMNSPYRELDNHCSLVYNFPSIFNQKP